MSVSISNLIKKRNAGNLQVVNKFDMLLHVDNSELDKSFEAVEIDTNYSTAFCNKNTPKKRGLKIGSWNFQGLCSNRKA